MITYVYPARSKGVCVGDDLARFTPMNYQLLANHGYVVLFPAAPRSLIQTPSGPTAGITPVVNAAIDRAIEELSVDAERLGLYGFSQGYHVALQILTETNRFKAAAVGNGLANFASAYGSTTMWSRFEGAEVVPLASRFEGASSPNRLGVQPWQDPDRYIQNSPIFFADRITTPLLIVHSDFDSFPLGQSDEIFNALYRQRKEASYAIYWGETHGNLSPANIRDFWRRILDWFDARLCPEGKEVQAGACALDQEKQS